MVGFKFFSYFSDERRPKEKYDHTEAANQACDVGNGSWSSNVLVTDVGTRM